MKNASPYSNSLYSRINNNMRMCIGIHMHVGIFCSLHIPPSKCRWVWLLGNNSRDECIASEFIIPSASVLMHFN